MTARTTVDGGGLTERGDGGRLGGGGAPVRIPAPIDSEAGKLVYLYLATAGACPVADLVEGLGMSRLTLFEVLRTLEGRGLVERVEPGTYRAAS